jgi:hypothetical protein
MEYSRAPETVFVGLTKRLGAVFFAAVKTKDESGTS